MQWLILTELMSIKGVDCNAVIQFTDLVASHDLPWNYKVLTILEIVSVWHESAT